MIAVNPMVSNPWRRIAGIAALAASCAVRAEASGSG